VSRLFLFIFNSPDESGFSPGQAMARGSEFGVEQINVPAAFKQRRLNFEISSTRNRFKKADFQRSGHGLDSVMKQTARHRCIEQRRDHPAVQNAGIALP